MVEAGRNNWEEGELCDCPEHGIERRPFIIDAGHELDGEEACENCLGLIP